jgi:hypothetical protein
MKAIKGTNGWPLEGKMNIDAIGMNRAAGQQKPVSRVIRQGAIPVLGMSLLVAGCATGPTPAESFRQHLEKHPEEYRRVEILPIWFTGLAEMDASLTTNELKVISHQVASNLVTALAWVLTEKGYGIVQTSPVLSGRSDLEAFDAETRQLLEQVRTNFSDLAQQLSAFRPNQKGTRLGYSLGDSVTELRKKLGLGEADLLVLMESEAFFESPDAQHQRHKRNWTKGSALMPLYVAFTAAAFYGQAASGPTLPLEFSPAWNRHTILIADARTAEPLFWTSRKFPGQDGLNPDALKGKLRETLADLAQLPKQK